MFSFVSKRAWLLTSLLSQTIVSGLDCKLKVRSKAQGVQNTLSTPPPNSRSVDAASLVREIVAMGTLFWLNTPIQIPDYFVRGLGCWMRTRGSFCSVGTFFDLYNELWIWYRYKIILYIDKCMRWHSILVTNILQKFIIKDVSDSYPFSRKCLQR